MKTRTIQARVVPSVAQAIETIARQRGMVRPDGKPNISEVTRLLLSQALAQHVVSDQAQQQVQA